MQAILGIQEAVVQGSYGDQQGDTIHGKGDVASPSLRIYGGSDETVNDVTSSESVVKAI